MNTKEVAKQIELTFQELKGLSCRIDKHKDIYSVSAYVFNCVNVPAKLLENPNNYPLIASDLELFARGEKE